MAQAVISTVTCDSANTAEEWTKKSQKHLYFELDPMPGISDAYFKGVVYTRQIQMFTGKKFRLTSATIGVIATSEPKTVVRIPRDAVVQVLSGPVGNDRTLDVLYDGQTLMMFVDDIVHGAEEIT
jgi:hypothetical protein